MQQLPAMNSKVTFRGSAQVGECSGMVIGHYPTTQVKNGVTLMIPRALWRVSIRVSKVPTKWPFGQGTNIFTAAIRELTPGG